MKKLFFLTLTLSLILLTACGRQGNITTANTTTSISQQQEISSTASYPTSSEPKEWIKLNIPIEDIVEVGLSTTRKYSIISSGMYVDSKSYDPIVTKNKDQIRAVIAGLNEITFYLNPESEGISSRAIGDCIGEYEWSVWWVDKNGEKTVLQRKHNGYYYKDMCLTRFNFDDFEFFKNALNADWW